MIDVFDGHRVYKVNYTYTDIEGCDRQFAELLFTIPQKFPIDDIPTHIRKQIHCMCQSVVRMTTFYDPMSVTITAIGR